MKRNVAVFLVCFGILVGFWASAQAPAQARPFAEWMPAGALLYLESSDFATQLRDWNRSEVKSNWLESKNYEEFSTTRLVLKLKDVYGEFSSAAGFEPNLAELETVAGAEAAIALYDIGKLDLLYISRLPSAQLAQNVLTRVRSGYQTRSAAGQTYFVRQNGARSAAYAIVGDHVLVSTREDLLSAALELNQGSAAGTSLSQESWYQDALSALPSDAAGPAAVRLVMDLADVTRTPHFRSYWIQRNTAELQNYYAFMSQVRRTGGSFEEDRVLLRTAEEQAPTHESATQTLQRHVPDDVGLFQLWDTASTGFAMDLLREKFFAAGPSAPAVRRYAPAGSFDQPVGSYRDLQTRIDEAPRPSLAGALDLEAVRILVDSARLEAVLHLESSAPQGNATFVRSDAVVALRAASSWNSAELRTALTSAVASYQSVGDIGLRWRDVTSGAFTLSQWDGLLSLTMYVDGQTLWIARTPVLLGAALNRAASAAPPAQTGVYLARYAHRAQSAPYLKLMRMLDLSDQSNYSNFFSENIGSLASALDAVQSVSVVIQESGLVQRQTVRYDLTR